MNKNIIELKKTFTCSNPFKFSITIVLNVDINSSFKFSIDCGSLFVCVPFDL